jgi:hypothetical protein
MVILNLQGLRTSWLSTWEIFIWEHGSIEDPDFSGNIGILLMFHLIPGLMGYYSRLIGFYNGLMGY